MELDSVGAATSIVFVELSLLVAVGTGGSGQGGNEGVVQKVVVDCGS